MKFFWRVMAGIALMPLFLGGFAMIWLAFFFDPENYRDQLIGWASERSGSAISINGQLTFNLSISARTPILTFVIDDVELKSAYEASSSELFSVSRVKVEVSAGNLIRGRIRPMITMEKPRLNLIRIDKDTVNWHNVSTKLFGRKQALSEWELIQGFASVALMGIRVIDGTLSWSQVDRKTEVKISELGVVVNPYGRKRIASIQAVLQPKIGLFDGVIPIDSSIEFALDSESGAIHAEDIKLNLTGPSAMTTLNVSKATIDQVNQELHLWQVAISGAVQGEEFLLNLERGTYSQVSESLVIANLGVKWIGRKIEGSAKLSLFSIDSIRSIKDKLRPHINRYQLLTNFEEVVKVFQLVDHLVLASGQVMFSFPNWPDLPLFSINSFGNGERPFEGTVNLSVGEYGVDIDNFDLNWIDSKMRGSIIRSKDGKTRLNFEVIEKHLEVTGVSLFGVSPMINPAVGFLGLLLNDREFVSVGNIKIERLLWGNLSVAQLNIPLKSTNDSWKSDNASFELYGGKGIVDVEIKETHKGFVINTSQDYIGVDIGSFLMDFGLTDRVQAVGNLSVETVSDYPINLSILKASRGLMTIFVSKGHVHDLRNLMLFDKDIMDRVGEFLTTIGLNFEMNLHEDSIKFSEFRADIHLANGHLSSDKVALKTSGWNLEGKGTYSLMQDRYNSIWYLSPDIQLGHAENSFLSRLSTLIIPIRVSGQSESISVDLDMLELIGLLSP